MSIPVVLNVTAALLYSAAVIVLFTVSKDRLHRNPRFFLAACAVIGLLLSVSNILEHADITVLLDYYVENMYVPLFVFFIYSLVVHREIERRKRNEESIARSLREREVLIREVHHRVKNNLQIVSSLLRLQHQNINDPAVREIFNTTGNRILAISLIHEILYRGENFAVVRADTYLRNLAEAIRQAYMVPGKAVRINYSLDESALDLDTAVPLGIIVTELVSNAFKHAFSEHPEGIIEIQLRNEGGAALLTVSDNGRGLEDPEPGSGQTLGLTLVCSLAKQLRGAVEFHSSGGVSVTVTVPLPGNGGDTSPSGGTDR